jgi:hypothetical protein
MYFEKATMDNPDNFGTGVRLQRILTTDVYSSEPCGLL